MSKEIIVTQKQLTRVFLGRDIPHSGERHAQSLYMQSINAHNGWFPINCRPFAISEMFTYDLEICTFFIFAIRNRSINLSKVTGTNGFLLNTTLVKIHLNIANGKLKVKLRCHLGKHYLVDQGRRVVFLSGGLVVTLA